MPHQTPHDFPIRGRYEHYLGIDLSLAEISEKIPVAWKHYDEDGLGRAAIAGFYLPDGVYFMLRYLYNAPIPATTIMFAVGTSNIEILIEEICEDFGFGADDIVWTSECLRAELIRGGAKKIKNDK